MKKIFAFFIAFSFFPTVFANIPEAVIPSGETVGISILTDGLLVIDTKEFKDKNGNKISPAKNAGIKNGDRILSADGKQITSSEDLSDYVKERKNDIVLTVNRDGETLNKVISPIYSEDGYKLGIWVRDSTAGLGTVTFINPETGAFGALGHGISDIDTNTLLSCREGLLIDCTVTPPIKGKKGEPGALCADFNSEIIAKFNKNSECGLFGEISDTSYINPSAAVKIASAQEITEGEATILSDVDGSGVSEYKIEIKKFKEGNLDGKNITFKVTDESLISKTGGIVQGMSGSPIVQNGKLVGAVTHVFVNDPTRGYGIFIENMLAEAEKIK